MLSFPFGKNDDMVDGLAWLGLMLQEMDTPAGERPKKKKSWRDRLNKFVTNASGRRRNMMTA
jgi:hypothetical protein